MQSAYSTTTVYKIDPATGYAALYPLLLTAQGTSAVIGNSEPVISELNFKDSEMVRDGRLVKQFLRYTDNLCKPDDNQCQPMMTTRFTWNGKAFAQSGYEKKRTDYLAKLARQRQCIKQKFDPKKGTADCEAEFDCPKYNDLSLLNLEAGNLGEARNYAEGALDFCRSNFTEFQAAQYNYRQSTQNCANYRFRPKDDRAALINLQRPDCRHGTGAGSPTAMKTRQCGIAKLRPPPARRSALAFTRRPD